MKIGDIVRILVKNPVGIESKDYEGCIGRVIETGEIFCRIEIRFLSEREEWYFRRNDLKVLSK